MSSSSSLLYDVVVLVKSCINTFRVMVSFSYFNEVFPLYSQYCCLGSLKVKHCVRGECEAEERGGEELD